MCLKGKTADFETFDEALNGFVMLSSDYAQKFVRQATYEVAKIGKLVEEMIG